MDRTLLMPNQDMPDFGFDQVVIEIHGGSAWVAKDRVHTLILQCLDDNL
jgi:hypothetical protein